ERPRPLGAIRARHPDRVAAPLLLVDGRDHERDARAVGRDVRIARQREAIRVLGPDPALGGIDPAARQDEGRHAPRHDPASLHGSLVAYCILTTIPIEYSHLMPLAAVPRFALLFGACLLARAASARAVVPSFGGD